MTQYGIILDGRTRIIGQILIDGNEWVLRTHDEGTEREQRFTGDIRKAYTEMRRRAVELLGGNCRLVHLLG